MVSLIRTTAELLAARKAETAPVGFVPTMGNLHAGHISLLEEALKEFHTVYFSIFVNPKQFGPSEDFNRYPRTLEQDRVLIEDKLKSFPQKKVVVFSPLTTEEIFPPGSDQIVEVTGISEVLEGKIRPGHFSGVATVVLRLFDLVKPQRAYFGLKDYQQYLVIKKMVSDLNLPLEIRGMPIVRESSGLALSSRNQYLTSEQKEQALLLSKTLRKIKAAVTEDRSLQSAKKLIQDSLTDKNWNYLELRDSETLSTDLRKSKNLTLLGVYQLGTTRLLDNMQVELP